MKVIITDEISEQGLKPILDDDRVQVDVRLGLSRDELHKVIGDYDAIITRSGTQVDREQAIAGRDSLFLAPERPLGRRALVQTKAESVIALGRTPLGDQVALVGEGGGLCVKPRREHDAEQRRD